MSSLHGTVSHTDRGGDDKIWMEIMQQKDCCSNVRNRVHSPQLVEMDLIYRSAVGLGFRHGNVIVNGSDIGTDQLRNLQTVKDGADLFHWDMRMGRSISLRFSMIGDRRMEPGNSLTLF